MSVDILEKESGDLKLMDDGSYYNMSFRTYKQHSEQPKVQHEWFQNELGPRLGDLFSTKDEIRVLSTGSGEGSIDMDIINQIVTQGIKSGKPYRVFYQVVELNEVAMESFRKKVENVDAFNSVTFSWYKGTFDEFHEYFLSNNELAFDLAHFIRCFYYFDSVVALDKTYSDLLATDGMAVVVGESEQSCWPQLYQYLHDLDLTKGYFECSGDNTAAYCMEYWYKQAEERKWKSEIFKKNYTFDCTPVLIPNSDVGKVLMDFFFHQRDAETFLGKDIIEKARHLYKASSYEKVELKENGVKSVLNYMTAVLGVIIIYKE